MLALDRLRARCLLGGLAVLLLAAAPGCDSLGSRVARGQLVVTGLSPYDDFFRMVHREQVASRTWADERRDNRKGVVASLGLLPDASSEVIVAALKGRPKSQPLAGVEAVMRAELARAERAEAHAARLGHLAKEGDDLVERLRREVSASGKRREAERELVAGANELRELAIAERTHTRDARSFASALVDFGGASPVIAPTPPKRPMKPLTQKPVAPAGKNPPDPKPQGEVFIP